MVMFYIDELKVKEIATRLNINETTVSDRKLATTWRGESL